MPGIGFKLTHFFLPVLALALGMAALYSAANWSLVAGNGPLPLDEDLVTLWLPGLIALALVLRFIHPRLRRLALSEKRGVPFMFDVLAFAAVAVPTAVLQFYIGAVAGGVAHIPQASDIARDPAAKYYTVDIACFARDKAVADVVVNDDDDRGDVLRVTFYVAVPTCQAGASKTAWLGIKYSDTMSARQSDAKKQAKFKALGQKFQTELDTTDFSRYRYFERAGNNADHRALEKTVRKYFPNIATPVILVPHLEPVAERTGHMLIWAFGAFVAGMLAWLIALLFAPLRTEEEVRAAEPAPLANENDGPTFKTLLVPSRSNYGLPVLLDINIAVYLCMVLAGLGVMSFATDDLLAWGASYRPAIHGLGIFRLITSQFVHGGFLHIANNMYGLLFVALCLAPAVRNARLIVCYLLCGLGGSLASVAYSVTVSVGASGAIFGLYGILLVLYMLKDERIRELGRAVWSSAAIFVGINLVFGFVSPSTDNACHVGGLLTGLILGGAIFLIDRPRVRGVTS